MHEEDAHQTAPKQARPATDGERGEQAQDDPHQERAIREPDHQVLQYVPAIHSGIGVLRTEEPAEVRMHEPVDAAVRSPVLSARAWRQVVLEPGRPPTSDGRRVSGEHQVHVNASSATLQQDSGAVVELREEELTARKQSVETGQVRIGTEVTSRQQTLEVPVRHDEVTIERQVVDRRPADGQIGDQSGTITVPVFEEQVALEKQSVVYEELNIGQQKTQETKRVSGTVRKEVVDVHLEGDVQSREQR